MEALQRIRVCRLFDIFALLHCLHTLCSDSSSSSSVEGGAVAAAVAAGGGGVEGVSLQQVCLHLLKNNTSGPPAVSGESLKEGKST